MVVFLWEYDGFSLGFQFYLMEIYRESGNMVEVQVMVKVKMADALKAAKKAYGDKLRQKSDKLAKELDEIVKY